MKFKATRINLKELFGKDIKAVRMEYKNPVKELHEYGEAVEKGRKMLPNIDFEVAK